MTWIVGANSFFGQAILASDICVTITSKSKQKSYSDCLQKVYPLGRFVIGGFAGSVCIGFAMMDSLHREFSTTSNEEAWNLDIVANTWLPRVTKRVFKLASEVERKLGCQIILATVHPTKNRGDAPYPWTDIYIFSSPEFKPVKANQNQVLGIGSGSSVAVYMNAIQAACNDFTFHQTAMGGDTAQGRLIASVVEKTVKENPISGVSSFFQVALVNRIHFKIFNHEYDIYPPGQPKIEIRCPSIAKNFPQFRQIMKDNGWISEGTVC